MAFSEVNHDVVLLAAFCPIFKLLELLKIKLAHIIHQNRYRRHYNGIGYNSENINFIFHNYIVKSLSSFNPFAFSKTLLKKRKNKPMINKNALLISTEEANIFTHFNPEYIELDITLLTKLFI